MKRRFGFNGATLGPADLLTDLRAAREGGYEGLEIRDTKLRAYLDGGGTLDGLRRELQEAGVEAYTLNALEHVTPPAGAPLEVLLRRCGTLCEWAAAIACPYVVAVPSSRDEVADPERTQETAVAVLRAMAEVGRRSGVGIGFEFLGFADCTVNTLQIAREIVEAVEDPGVGLVIDAFHFYAGGSTWEMFDGLDPRRLVIVHLDDAEDRPRRTLADAHRLLPGDGVIPLREFVRRIEALGYTGPYSIELFRPEYYAWDPIHLAKVAREKMDALFG